ncbi:MAG: hypothetical protein GVY36_16225 [Verrucomicrobia bacterium]|nr:hypothetical protein [Verrucomicrobiota bacterium]
MLKPRTKSLSDRLDEFLENHGLDRSETPIRCDATRPKAPGVNAIRCARCGQAEYLSRDYCRCGHYLRGQLEDEYLSWLESKEEVVEKLALETEKRNKQVRWLFCIATALLLVPLITIAIFPLGSPLLGLGSFLVALIVAGTACAVENTTEKKVVACNLEFLDADMTEYLFVRSSLVAENENHFVSNGKGGEAGDV